MARRPRSITASEGRKSDPFVKNAHQRFEMGQEASKDQRVRNIERLRFYDDDQWPADIKALRAGTPGNADMGQPAAPARPCITINKVKEPVKQVLNQMRQSDMGAEITPADDFGDVTEVDDDEIELREGLLRRIQRAPETSDAILWMGSRAAICGEGYMGVMTRFLKGRTFDQEPYVCRFYNQSSVTIDPAHEQPDGSDADWGFVGTDIPYDQYIAEFPRAYDGKPNRLTGANDDEWRAYGEEAPGWYHYAETTEDSKDTKYGSKIRMCRVVDYYYTERESVELALLPDGQTVLAKDVPEGIEPLMKRQEITKSIKWAKIDGCQVLDKGDWPGPDIPIIKCLGEEMQPYDNQRRANGMVTESAMQANRGGNYMISKLVETIGLAPIPPLMMAAGQDEGFEQEYATMNTRTLAVLHYNAKDSEGNLIGPPTRPPVDTQIQPMVMALQYFNEAVLSVVGQPSPTLGEVDPSIKTKGGLEALLTQAQIGNSNYVDNLARSVRRMAVILNNLFYPLYTNRPGRLVRIVNGEGEPEMATINASEERNVTPMGEMSQEAPQQPQKPKKRYTLTEDAHFNVAIKVVKNEDTRRDQESTMLGELIASNPEFMQWFGDKFLKASNIPDHKELAERAKVMLAPPILAMMAEKDKGEPVPPHIQAQMAKSQEVIQQLTQANQELLKERETDGVKAQADLQKTQMQDQSKQLIEQMKAMSAESLAALKLQFEQWKVEFMAEQDAKTREDEQRHEMALAAAEAAQKDKDAEAQRQHDANMGRQAHESGELAGERSHEQSLEAGEQGHRQNLEAQAAKPKPSKGEK